MFDLVSHLDTKVGSSVSYWKFIIYTPPSYNSKS
jgi:hypothetical protein